MENKIRQIIKKELGIKVTWIKKIAEGFSHHMYLIGLEKSPNIVIMRFLNASKEEYGLEKEKYIISLLRKNKVPAPKIYAFNKSISGNEGYMILEKLPGTRLDLIWASLAREEKINITEKIGKLLSSIHRIKLSHFGRIGNNGRIISSESFKFKKVGKEIKYSPFLKELLTDFFEDFTTLLSYKIVNPKFIADFIFYLSKHLKNIDYSGKPTLIHGDFMPDHLFVEKRNKEYHIVGLIDFEFAYSYSPEYDFIKLHRKGFFNDAGLKKALNEGYGKDINEQVVETYRLMRDLQFAAVMFSSGNKNLALKIINTLKQKIN